MTPTVNSSRRSRPYLNGPATEAALDFIAERHGGQLRESDGAPFVLHPLEVGEILRGCGYHDSVVTAGVLHDVLEHSDTSAPELRARFGRRVARLVEAVTEDPSIEDRVERKARLRDQVAAAGPEAGAIFAADELSKVRELRIRAVRDPDTMRSAETHKKLRHYQASLAMLERSLCESTLLAQLSFELEALLARASRRPVAA